MKTTVQEMLDSHEFRQMVSRRWTVSVILTTLLFFIYYGYIVLIAVNKPFLARRIGEGVTTLGIPMGVGVIVLAWILTAVYVVWANTVHDTEVRRLRDQVTKH
jgi:uncharacterized membrane protein (DUF485 family)